MTRNLTVPFFIMLKHAIQLNQDDNIAVCTSEVDVGDTVEVRCGAKVTQTLTAGTPISYCNKIALKDLHREDLISKYGEVIGKATAEISLGALVNHENIVGIARNYADEYLGGH